VNSDPTARKAVRFIDLTADMRHRPDSSSANLKALAQLEAGVKEILHDHTGYKTPTRVYVAQLCRRRGKRFRYQITVGNTYKIRMDTEVSGQSGQRQTVNGTGKDL